MKKLSQSFAIIVCALSSAYFIGCGSDADSDDNNSAGSGGEAGNGSGDAGSSSNGGSGGSTGGSGGTVNNGGGGSANGGSSGGGAANGGTGGSIGGTGGTGGSDVGGAAGDNQGGGGAGGSGGQGNPPSADCEELCLGNADSDSIFTMCPEFTTGAQGYFGGSEATCLSECAANEATVWDMGCRIMHLETIYNQQSFNDGVHCPHVNGAAPCANLQ